MQYVCLQRHRLVLAFTLFFSAWLTGCRPAPPRPLPADPKQAFYVQHVEPVLQENCFRCHAGMNKKGDFRMNTRAALLKGGKSGVDVLRGDAEHSRLVQVIHRNEKAGKPMPPDGPISAADIAAITRWIDEGAAMPPPQ